MISTVRAVRAVAIRRSRSAYSWSSVKAGSPSRYGTAFPCRIRETPSDSGMVGIAVQRATGIPNRSISFVIVAPQRLQVPQVAVRMAACTWASTNSRAISRPNWRARATGMTLPTVLYRIL